MEVAGDGEKQEKMKRDRRKFVLEECMKRGMDLRQNFNSYPYESKIYPAIKTIISATPPSWGWNREVTRDMIRTLCWGRVRTENRRNKEIDTEEIEGTEANTSHKRYTKPKMRVGSSDDPETDTLNVPPPTKASKTFHKTPIAAITTKKQVQRPIQPPLMPIATSPINSTSPFSWISLVHQAKLMLSCHLPSLPCLPMAA